MCSRVLPLSGQGEKPGALASKEEKSAGQVGTRPWDHWGHQGLSKGGGSPLPPGSLHMTE